MYYSFVTLHLMQGFLGASQNECANGVEEGTTVQTLETLLEQILSSACFGPFTHPWRQHGRWFTQRPSVQDGLSPTLASTRKAEARGSWVVLSLHRK